MKDNRAVRNSSIETLRIIAMLGVITLHYNNSSLGGALSFVENGSVNQYCLFFFESLFICAVDLFIMISAYYLSNTKKRKMIKIVELIMQVIIFNLCAYFASILFGDGSFSVRTFVAKLLPCSYFVILYSVLYIVSPYINVIIEKISEKDLKRLVITLFVIFSVWSYGVDVLESITAKEYYGLSPVSARGSQDGYTIVNFVLAYFIGAYINKHKIKMRASVATGAAFALILAIWRWAMAEQEFGFRRTAWNYNSPFVILLAVVVLLLFQNFNYKSRIINELARAAFTCYLFHKLIIQRVKIEEFVGKPTFIMILHLIAVTVGIYLLSYIVYKIYSLCVGWFVRLITPTFEKINISLD